MRFRQLHFHQPPACVRRMGSQIHVDVVAQGALVEIAEQRDKVLTQAERLRSQHRLHDQRVEALCKQASEQLQARGIADRRALARRDGEAEGIHRRRKLRCHFPGRQ
ncbi:hypothetical protein ACVWWG_005301 [Bradyrhizobium sp. LB7.2]